MTPLYTLTKFYQNTFKTFWANVFTDRLIIHKSTTEKNNLIGDGKNQQ